MYPFALLVNLLIINSYATTYTFDIQNGVSMTTTETYTGSHSVAISTYAGLGSPGEWNQNGATFADDAHWCLGNSIPNNPNIYDQRILLKFSGLRTFLAKKGVPNGTAITKAELTLHAHADDTHGDVFLNALYPKRDWADNTPGSCAGCSAAEVGWRFFASGLAWEGFGGSGAGDTVSGLAARIPPTGFLKLGWNMMEFKTELDLPTVQKWTDQSDDENFGLLLVTGVSGVHVGVVPTQYTNNATQRPKLTLTLDTEAAIASPTSTPTSTPPPASSPSPRSPGENSASSLSMYPLFLLLILPVVSLLL